MKWTLGTNILKVMKEYLYPDNVNKCSVLFFICILLFWYSTCVISGLTEKRFFYVSSALLNDLGKESKAKTIHAIIGIFLVLVWGAFNRKALRLLVFVVLFCDVFFRHSSPFGDYWFHFWRDFPGDRADYFYEFFSSVISKEALQKIFPSFNENTIGRAYLRAYNMGFLMCGFLAIKCLGLKWRWKSLKVGEKDV